MPLERSLIDQRLSKMVEEIEDYAIVLLDREGNVENWNKGAEKMKGYTAEEIIGRHFSTFYPPEDKAAGLPAQLLEKAAQEGKARHEGWRLRKDGTRFWANVLITAIHNDDRQVLGFTKVVRDLTAIKMGEEALKRTEERYHKMISEVQDYAIILLNAVGNIEKWNKGAEKIKGYAADEIIGKSFKIFYFPEDVAQKIPDSLLEAARRNGRVQHEGWRRRKDGSRFWGMVTITALHNDNGEVIGFSKVTRDMTEKLLAEQLQQQYVAELEAKNKELEQFTYITSHDLQEPLRTVTSFTELLQSTYEDQLDDKGRMFTGVIRNAALRMSDLVKGLLDYSRIGTQKNITEVNCNMLVSNICSDMQTLIAETSTQLHVGKLPVVTGYRTELAQLFQNLISNAIKYRKEDINPEVYIEARQDGDNWLFSVRDNGIGIEPRYFEKIFMIFKRLHTRDQYPGSGIGLANCKKIVDLHGGTIWLESELDKGSTFFFTIPINKTIA